jgi:copper(I)-binding protein
MMNKHLSVLALVTLIFLSACGKKEPHVEISNAWTRATLEEQDVGAAYMTLTANTDLTLNEIESSVTEDVEIHSMSMENGVMKMRMLDKLSLKANTPVELSPGGFHLMLFDLENPLKAGEKVRFTLHFKDKQGKELTLNIDSPVKAE